MPERVNLYSDTQTRPTAAMRKAIAEAEVGDEQRGLDPTTSTLERLVAEPLGHEAALFLPSGTIATRSRFACNRPAETRRSFTSAPIRSTSRRVDPRSWPEP